MAWISCNCHCCVVNEQATSHGSGHERARIGTYDHTIRVVKLHRSVDVAMRTGWFNCVFDTANQLLSPVPLGVLLVVLCLDATRSGPFIHNQLSKLYESEMSQLDWLEFKAKLLTQGPIRLIRTPRGLP